MILLKSYIPVLNAVDNFFKEKKLDEHNNAQSTLINFIPAFRDCDPEVGVSEARLLIFLNANPPNINDLIGIKCGIDSQERINPDIHFSNRFIFGLDARAPEHGCCIFQISSSRDGKAIRRKVYRNIKIRAPEPAALKKFKSYVRAKYKALVGFAHNLRNRLRSISRIKYRAVFIDKSKRPKASRKIKTKPLFLKVKPRKTKS